jgi:hypothetical protein
MVASHTPRASAEAALHLNLKLLAADWPEELLDVAVAQQETDPVTGAVLFRCALGSGYIYIHAGLLLHSGRACLLGNLEPTSAALHASLAGLAYPSA